LEQQPHSHFADQANTFFQSFFMPTTVPPSVLGELQPFLCASGVIGIGFSHQGSRRCRTHSASLSTGSV
jgi:hypothetical protein